MQARPTAESNFNSWLQCTQRNRSLKLMTDQTLSQKYSASLFQATSAEQQLVFKNKWLFRSVPKVTVMFKIRSTRMKTIKENKFSYQHQKRDLILLKSFPSHFSCIWFGLDQCISSRTHIPNSVFGNTLLLNFHEVSSFKNRKRLLTILVRAEKKPLWCSSSLSLYCLNKKE